MVAKYLILGTLVVGLSGCASLRESRANPFNWFAKSEPAVVDPATLRPLVPAHKRIRTVDRRGLVDQVVALTVAPADGGALVQATGVGERQGAYNAQLVPVSFENGTLSLAFRVQYPSANTPQGSPASREIAVAELLSFEQLSGVRRIQVSGASSARSARR